MHVDLVDLAQCHGAVEICGAMACFLRGFSGTWVPKHIWVYMVYIWLHMVFHGLYSGL